jgi:hypothetical protein
VVRGIEYERVAEAQRRLGRETFAKYRLSQDQRIHAGPMVNDAHPKRPVSNPGQNRPGASVPERVRRSLTNGEDEVVEAITRQAGI